LQTHYEVLGVSRSASEAEIRAAYLRLMRANHPDVNPRPEAVAVSIQVNKAYAVLRDKEQRGGYDHLLNLKERKVPPVAARTASRNDPASRRRRHFHRPPQPVQPRGSAPPLNPFAHEFSHWKLSNVDLRTIVMAVGFVLTIALSIIAIGYLHITGPAPPSTGKGARRAALDPNSPRMRTKKLVSALNEQLRGHATFIGDVPVDDNLVPQYRLDRTNYISQTFAGISSGLGPLMGDREANFDELATNSYYIARLMESSIAVLDDFEQDRDLSQDIRRVEALGEINGMQAWMNASKCGPPFAALTLSLQELALEQQQPASSKSTAAGKKRHQELYRKAELAFNHAMNPALLKGFQLQAE
jgi:hypothetical protein